MCLLVTHFSFLMRKADQNRVGWARGSGLNPMSGELAEH